jgi:hypothetical protein
MSEENSNSQVQPSDSPVATGPTVAELQARVAELETAKQGLIRDRQREAEKRQELEARLSIPPTVSSPVPVQQQSDVNNAELANLISPVVAPMIAAQTAAFEAKQYLASKAGKTWAELANDRDFQSKLESTINKYGISGDYYNVAVKAYEAMKRDEELDTYRKREADQRANSNAVNSTSLPAGAPPEPAKSAIEVDMETWKREGARLWNEHNHKSSIRKVGDKIVITPH